LLILLIVLLIALINSGRTNSNQNHVKKRARRLVGPTGSTAPEGIAGTAANTGSIGPSLFLNAVSAVQVIEQIVTGGSPSFIAFTLTDGSIADGWTSANGGTQYTPPTPVFTKFRLAFMLRPSVILERPVALKFKG